MASSAPTARPVSALPSLLTLCGLLSGLLGVLVWPLRWAPALLLLSLALDAIDGHVARSLGAATPNGARFDRAADTAVAYGLAWRVLPPGWGALAALVLAGVAARGVPLPWLGGRIPSGRVALTAAVVAWRAIGGAP